MRLICIKERLLIFRGKVSIDVDVYVYIARTIANVHAASLGSPCRGQGLRNRSQRPILWVVPIIMLLHLKLVMLKRLLVALETWWTRLLRLFSSSLVLLGFGTSDHSVWSLLKVLTLASLVVLGSSALAGGALFPASFG